MEKIALHDTDSNGKVKSSGKRRSTDGFADPPDWFRGKLEAMDIWRCAVQGGLPGGSAGLREPETEFALDSAALMVAQSRNEREPCFVSPFHAGWYDRWPDPLNGRG
jgi:hypothetical protein